MTISLLFKGVVFFFLLVILFSLFRGLFFLVRDQGRSEQTVKSLTARIIISIGLFIILIIGFATGSIKPHGLPQVQPDTPSESAK